MSRLAEELSKHGKSVICALFVLILPFLGIGLPELGAKGPTDTEVVRIMSFNVRDGEFDREEIVPQVVADYMPDSVGLQECEGTWYLTLKTYKIMREKYNDRYVSDHYPIYSDMIF